MGDARTQAPILELPSEWAGDPELVEYHTQLTDVITKLYENSFWYNERVTADYTSVNTLYTPVPKERIVCDNTSTMTATLYSDPRDGDEFICERSAASTALVTIDGNGKNINGSSTQVLSNACDAPHLHFWEDDDEWGIV